MVSFSFVLRDGEAGPLYRQLYDALKNEIVSGNWKAGDKLPSKRCLAADARISQNTIETAYEQLIAEGYIRPVSKSGYYVCKLEGMVPVPPRVPAPPSEPVARESAIYRYDFQTNTVDTSQFPFATWARISREIIHDENRSILQVSHPQGDLALRECIANYLHGFRGVRCVPEQIVVGAGTEYLLGLIVQFLGRGNVYAVENPGYLKTHRVLAGSNADVRLVGLDEQGLNVRLLEDSLANVAYITPSHHFPLGTVMPVNRRLQLLQWANGHADRYIIEDDYDSEFRFSGRPIPALQGLGSDKVIYISTFSKSLAPSIRVSYMVLPPRLLEEYRRSFSFYSSTVSRFEQFTICRFMKDGHFERHLNRMRNLYKSRRDALVENIRRQLGPRFAIAGENAGMHLLLKSGGRLTEKEMMERAAQAGVRVYGLSDYYIQPTEDMPMDTVLLGYAHYDAGEAAGAVEILKAAWGQNQGI